VTSNGGETSSRDTDEEIVLALHEGIDDPRAEAERLLPSGATILKVNETLNHVLAVLPATDGSVRPADVEKDASVRYTARNPDVDPAQQAGSGDIRPPPGGPNDPEYVWQTAPEVTNAPAAWEVTQGSKNVTLAIVDSGIKYDHEDLAANMDDSVPDHGRNIIDETSDPYPQSFWGPPEDHGTRTAGIAGAVTNNGVGVAGTSDCSMLSVRVGDWTTGSGWADAYDVVSGTEWAARNGADVILANVDGGGAPEWSPFDDAVSYAESQGALVIVAAGNEGSEFDEYAYASQAHVAVSATDGDGNLADFSSYGEYVDVAAPGRSGYTTYPAKNGEPADEYIGYGGTSMAAPVTAGVAGLVLSVDPTVTVQELKNVLMETATDLGISDTKQGAGRVDAKAAVQAVVDPLSIDATSDTITPGGTAQISLSATGMERIKIENVWTDWTVTSTSQNGATFTDNTSGRGHCRFSWDGVRNSVSPSVTFDVPDRYIGGTYELPVIAERNNQTSETTVTVEVR
jgi:serine protease